MQDLDLADPGIVGGDFQLGQGKVLRLFYNKAFPIGVGGLRGHRVYFERIR